MWNAQEDGAVTRYKWSAWGDNQVGRREWVNREVTQDTREWENEKKKKKKKKEDFLTTTILQFYKFYTVAQEKKIQGAYLFITRK